MEHPPNKSSIERRQLKSLNWISARWDCSRQTCRRALERHGVCPFHLGGDARNATLRFDLQDLLKVEASAQGRDCSLKSSSRSRVRSEGRAVGADSDSASTILPENRSGRRR